jgi:glycosyltransferase involved in cell wall biosynthesis
VRALPEVFARFPNAVCLFVGGVEPGAEEKLETCKRICAEAGISDRVFFLGSRPDVPAILASLDLFVFSALHEGGSPPVAIIEAMFASVPVLASDIPPHLEYAAELQSARLFKTGDPADLAAKIIELLNDPPMRREIARQTYLHAMERFSTERRLADFRDLYQRLLSE